MNNGHSVHIILNIEYGGETRVDAAMINALRRNVDSFVSDGGLQNADDSARIASWSSSIQVVSPTGDNTPALPLHLEDNVLDATKHAGTLNPAEAMPFIEERLTLDEHDLLSAFLGWLLSSQKTIGWGNIQAQYRDFLRTTGTVPGRGVRA